MVARNTAPIEKRILLIFAAPGIHFRFTSCVCEEGDFNAKGSNNQKSLLLAPIPEDEAY